MNIENYVEVASIAASAVGILASIFTVLKTKKQLSIKTQDSFYQVIQSARNELDILGITLSQILRNENILSGVKHKISQGIKVRVILASEKSVQQWGESLGLASERIEAIVLNHKESIQRLLESGVEVRLIDHIGPVTFVLSDNFLVNKPNSFSNDLESGSVIVTSKPSMVAEYRNMFHSLWASSYGL
jgi:hypothetical protein